MATPPPGFPIPAFELKDLSSIFERMPLLFDGGVYNPQKFGRSNRFTWVRKLRSPDVEQMRDDIQRAEELYAPKPVTFTITIRKVRHMGLPICPNCKSASVTPDRWSAGNNRCASCGHTAPVATFHPDPQPVLQLYRPTRRGLKPVRQPSYRPTEPTRKQWWQD